MVKLIWATPEIDRKLAYMARVSNPANQAHEESAPKLIRWMLDNGHVSPFEMANACFEIDTTRDIGRQILRHRSFSFQEFSQRYQKTEQLPPVPMRECRMQDSKNRQSSLENFDRDLDRAWQEAQQQIVRATQDAYKWALSSGIAKEVARSVLPEGLTATRMYMNGTIRSWIHYLRSRLDPSTQKEHREIAMAIVEELRQLAPDTMEAAGL